MKNYLAVGALMSVLFAGCTNEESHFPEESNFPIEPYIEFRELTFGQGEASNFAPDTLSLSIYFHDGDMDLGLSDTTVSDPHHPYNYFLEDGAGNLIPVSTYRRYDDFGDIIKLKAGQTGTLATIRTHDNPLYASMPDYVCPYVGMNYSFTNINVSSEDGDIVGEDLQKIDTIDLAGNRPNVYSITDNFYSESNPDHFNIFVKFMVQNPDNSFSEFDWRTELCSSLDMSGRFPDLKWLRAGDVFSNNTFKVTGLSSNEGTLTYKMTSAGLGPLFHGKNLKLLVTIKDRALHTSNTIETSIIEIQ